MKHTIETLDMGNYGSKRPIQMVIDGVAVGHRLTSHESDIVKRWLGDDHFNGNCLNTLGVILNGETIREKVEAVDSSSDGLILIKLTDPIPEEIHAIKNILSSPIWGNKKRGKKDGKAILVWRDSMSIEPATPENLQLFSSIYEKTKGNGG